MISLIVATDINGGISKNKQIPWLHEGWSTYDLKRFKDLTSGSIIIMGRNTYNEIASLREITDNILPNRTSYVITSTPDDECPGAITVTDMKAVFALHPHETIFVIGGESLFNDGLQYADRIYHTNVLTDYGCDQFFKFNPDDNWSKYECNKDITGVEFIEYKKKE